MTTPWCERCGAERPSRVEPESGCLSCATHRAARIAMTDEVILALFRDAGFALHLAPMIPDASERRLREAWGELDDDERVLALHVSDGLGADGEGFAVTATRLAWKNAGERARSVAWAELDADRMYVDGDTLFFDGQGGGAHLRLPADDAVLDAIVDAFYVLALSANAGPDESQTILVAPAESGPAPRFSCWSCATAVDSGAARCASCGAEKAAHGWRRSA